MQGISSVLGTISSGIRAVLGTPQGTPTNPRTYVYENYTAALTIKDPLKRDETICTLLRSAIEQTPADRKKLELLLAGITDDTIRINEIENASSKGITLHDNRARLLSLDQDQLSWMVEGGIVRLIAENIRTYSNIKPGNEGGSNAEHNR